MIRAAWRDVVFRKRRFAIAMTATALVFALSLLLSGVSASFAREADRTLDDIGADAWVVREGSPGPFTSFVPMRAELRSQITSWSAARIDVMPAQLGDDSVLYGALELAGTRKSI